MGKLGHCNLLCTRTAVKGGLQLGSLSAGDGTGAHMPLFFSLLSPSLLPRPSVRGHFNDEHVLNSFVYLAAALMRHLKPFYYYYYCYFSLDLCL